MVVCYRYGWGCAMMKKGDVFISLFPSALSTALRHLRFSCAIFSPESKPCTLPAVCSRSTPKLHRNCTKKKVCQAPLNTEPVSLNRVSTLHSTKTTPGTKSGEQGTRKNEPFMNHFLPSAISFSSLCKKERPKRQIRFQVSPLTPYKTRAWRQHATPNPGQKWYENGKITVKFRLTSRKN
jgi:hypothetical protein